MTTVVVDVDNQEIVTDSQGTRTEYDDGWRVVSLNMLKRH